MEKIELEKIKEQFKEVIRYSQGIQDPKVEELFKKWETNKNWFIEKMDGKLIYEYPEVISLEMNHKDKMNRVSDFITEIDCKWNRLYGPTGVHDLMQFIEDMKDSFYSNTVSEDYPYQDKIIPKGMKLIKAFKFFIEDKETLTAIQMAASRYIQEDKIKGVLCFSVHPLDFLSSSENTHNWRSCHALDGEYRAGNLSYMCDPSTVICYLRSEHEDTLPNFPSTVRWNNKKWRMLVHFSDHKDMVFAGRQYPFESDLARDMILDEVFGRLGLGEGWTNWDNAQITTFDYNNGNSIVLKDAYIPIDRELKALKDLIYVPQNSLNYNDVLHSTYYTPYYSYKTSTYWNLYGSHDTHFIIGAAVNCLHCGKEVIELPETMRCIDCEEVYGTEDIEGFSYCDICGSRIYEDHGQTLYSGEWVCDDCVDNLPDIVRCADCGVAMFKTDAFLNENGDYYCRWCK